MSGMRPTDTNAVRFTYVPCYPQPPWPMEMPRQGRDVPHYSDGRQDVTVGPRPLWWGSVSPYRNLLLLKSYRAPPDWSWSITDLRMKPCNYRRLSLESFFAPAPTRDIWDELEWP